MLIGQTIKYCREKAGFSLTHTCNLVEELFRVKINKGELHRFENSENIKLEKFIYLCVIFNLDIKDFYSLNENTK